MVTINARNYLKKERLTILLLFLALASRFLFLSYPSEVVFDEVHFGKFVSAYFTQEYYFDIHPPLGKMMIAGFAKIAGLDFGGRTPDAIFSQIGDQMDKNALFVLRFLPALFGALFVVLIYKLLLLFGLSRNSAFLGASLVIFENSFLSQSKFILVDIFLMFFGFSALYFFMLSRKYADFNAKNVLFLVFSSTFAAMAFSVKWTGLSFLGIILVWIFISFLKNRPKKFSRLLAKGVIFTIIPLLVYLYIFYIHFALLPKSGFGNGYMSPAFQKTLSGNSILENVSPLNFGQKFIELNSAMYTYNKNITAQHPFSSKWYQWPLGQKPIWYWSKNLGTSEQNLYLLGNPIVWLLVLISAFFPIFALIIPKIRKKLPKTIFILLFAYFANLLPYIFIGRVTFLYHYLPSLTFGIIIFSILADKLIVKFRLAIYLTVFIFALAAFAAVLPLTYGFPLPSSVISAYRAILKL